MTVNRGKYYILNTYWTYGSIGTEDFYRFPNNGATEMENYGIYLFQVKLSNPYYSRNDGTFKAPFRDYIWKNFLFFCWTFQVDYVATFFFYIYIYIESKK